MTTSNDKPEQLGSLAVKDLASRNPAALEEARVAGQLAELLAGRDPDIDPSKVCGRCRGAMGDSQ